MARPMNNDWTELFEPAGSEATWISLRWRGLKKRGQPFLILPGNARLAAQSLGLYPAQSPFARAAKALLRAALQTGVPIGGEKIHLHVSRQDELVKFIAQLAGLPPEQLSPPAIL